MFGLDNETVTLLHYWHGGQYSATYSLMSVGKGTRETIERALDELTPHAFQNDEANYLTWKLESVLKAN